MELLPDGKMVLDEQDTVGVLALIYAKTRMVVDIHATTDSSLSTCHADPPRTRARAYAESNPLRQSPGTKDALKALPDFKYAS